MSGRHQLDLERRRQVDRGWRGAVLGECTGRRPSRIRSPGDVGVQVLGGVPADRRFTSIASMPGQNGAASGPTYWSPVITATGTPWCWATSALMPASPVTVPLRTTFGDRPRVVGVRQHAGRRHRGVVAEEHDRVVRRVESLHHVERLEPAREVRRPAAERRRRQVAHHRVAVVDQDLGGAGLERAVDRGVDLAEDAGRARARSRRRRRGTAPSRRCRPRPPCPPRCRPSRASLS